MGTGSEVFWSVYTEQESKGIHEQKWRSQSVGSLDMSAEEKLRPAHRSWLQTSEERRKPVPHSCRGLCLSIQTIVCTHT